MDDRTWFATLFHFFSFFLFDEWSEMRSLSRGMRFITDDSFLFFFTWCKIYLLTWNSSRPWLIRDIVHAADKAASSVIYFLFYMAIFFFLSFFTMCLLAADFSPSIYRIDTHIFSTSPPPRPRLDFGTTRVYVLSYSIWFLSFGLLSLCTINIT